jgi:hypothetical protein
MNISKILSISIDVDSRKRKHGSTNARTSKEKSKQRDGCTNGRIQFHKRGIRELCNDCRLGKSSQWSSISLYKGKQSIESIERQAWKKTKGLIPFFIFLMPYWNLLYIVDFVLMGYDTQNLNNIGVV